MATALWWLFRLNKESVKMDPKGQATVLVTNADGEVVGVVGLTVSPDVSQEDMAVEAIAAVIVEAQSKGVQLDSDLYAAVFTSR